jgi:hypothetical protein
LPLSIFTSRKRREKLALVAPIATCANPVAPKAVAPQVLQKKTTKVNKIKNGWRKSNRFLHACLFFYCVDFFLAHEIQGRNSTLDFLPSGVAIK